jgi:hypothetical protein
MSEFKKHLFLVKVATVRESRGKAIPKPMQYSVVREILKAHKG